MLTWPDFDLLSFIAGIGVCAVGSYALATASWYAMPKHARDEIDRLSQRDEQ